MHIFIRKILFPIIVFAFVSVLFFYYLSEYKKNDVKTSYELKSYKNTIALYNDEKIVKIYDDIVLNTLPKNDIQNFNIGVSVTNPTHADEYLENFD